MAQERSFRIILIGQAAFGRDCLKALIDQGEQIVGVITVPDLPGRPSPLKELALQMKIPLIQPAGLKGDDTYNWVASLRLDLLVLAYVTDIVPKRIIDLATYGGINYHPSLLPKYRGGSAVNWALICGEIETGVTIHRIDAGIDTGPIILQEKVKIDPDDTVKSLYFNKLYPIGVKMTTEAVRLIRKGKAKPIPQDYSQASFQPIIKEKDVIIYWDQLTAVIYNLIRGSDPHPGATTYFRGEKLKIWEAKSYQAQGRPGEIIQITEKGIIVGTGDGAILISKVQYGSSGKISSLEFCSTYGASPGDCLGS